ncbi:hypothetical protein [Nocardia sp. R6R-6]|uniref:hypothetical protein n=1 Tax=Nocardia sp. R6R-6 TaxID=3459303 RepID=UPI00403DA1B0
MTDSPELTQPTVVHMDEPVNPAEWPRPALPTPGEPLFSSERHSDATAPGGETPIPGNQLPIFLAADRRSGGGTGA